MYTVYIAYSNVHTVNGHQQLQVGTMSTAKIIFNYSYSPKYLVFRVCIPSFKISEFKGNKYVWPECAATIPTARSHDYTTYTFDKSLYDFFYVYARQKYGEYLLLVEPAGDSESYEVCNGKFRLHGLRPILVSCDSERIDKLAEELVAAGFAVAKSEDKKAANAVGYMIMRILEEKAAEEVPAEEHEELVEAEEAEEEAEGKPNITVELPELELEIEPAPGEGRPQVAAEAKPAEAVEAKEPVVELEEEKPEEEGEEEKIELPKMPPKEQLVKLYFLAMKLPSEDLAAKDKYIVRRVGGMTVSDKLRIYSDSKERAKLKRTLKQLRNWAYEQIARTAVYVDEYGVWLAVTEEAVRRCETVTRKIRDVLRSLQPTLRKLGKIVDPEDYVVKPVPVYLETKDALELLDVAIRKLLREIDELEERIEEAENRKKLAYAKKLQTKRSYMQKLLESLKEYLDKLTSQ